MKKEKVYTVDVFWDGPIAGVADFDGSPYYFDVIEDDVETEQGALNFTLIALNAEIFQLVLENIDIRLRWRIAFEKGETSYDTEPALPNDKIQFDLNRNKIDSYLFQHQSVAVIKKGIFSEIEKDLYEVVWS
jgi:hypothetical protein